MTSKLNRDQILRGILTSLVNGWGYRAVLTALHNLEKPAANGISSPIPRSPENDQLTAVQIIEQLEASDDRKRMMINLARDFDSGIAFPKLSDVRSFLVSHHRNPKDVKTRSQAFRRLMPIISGMSEKGLEKLISRSQHSGPAELDAISKAIRGAGEDLRGEKRTTKVAATAESVELNGANLQSIESSPLPGEDDDTKI